MKILSFILIALFVSCNQRINVKKQSASDNSQIETTLKDDQQILVEKEKASIEKNIDSLGDLISKIEFKVKTNNFDDYKEGYIPWITIEHPDNDLKQLIDKDKIVINENKVTVIVDYPLTNEYRFDLISNHGFTKDQLVKEISKNYHKIYEEEETTATIKTIPIDKRTTMYNRNETNGKYGIWGHDLADLVLADILVYKTKNGQIILSLEMES